MEVSVVAWLIDSRQRPQPPQLLSSQLPQPNLCWHHPEKAEGVGDAEGAEQTQNAELT